MTGLPLADAETRAFFLRWLETFSSHVREVDYASARSMFYPQILAVGTQWDNVWPRTSDFHFSLDATQVLASADGSLAVVIAPWTSTFCRGIWWRRAWLSPKGKIGCPGSDQGEPPTPDLFQAPLGGSMQQPGAGS
jgi:hypothetical protein